MTDRLQNFENMLKYVQNAYDESTKQVDKLKSTNKSKTVSFKQALSLKMQYKQILNLYEKFNLI